MPCDTMTGSEANKLITDDSSGAPTASLLMSLAPHADKDAPSSSTPPSYIRSIHPKEQMLSRNTEMSLLTVSPRISS